MARPRPGPRPRFVKLPLTDTERALLADLMAKRTLRARRKPRPARCVKCGAKTMRKLNNESGVCPACEPDKSP